MAASDAMLVEAAEELELVILPISVVPEELVIPDDDDDEVEATPMEEAMLPDETVDVLGTLMLVGLDAGIVELDSGGAVACTIGIGSVKPSLHSWQGMMEVEVRTTVETVCDD